jgi:hypothetical protein
MCHLVFHPVKESSSTDPSFGVWVPDADLVVWFALCIINFDVECLVLDCLLVPST